MLLLGALDAARQVSEKEFADGYKLYLERLAASLELQGVSVEHLRTVFAETVQQCGPYLRHRCTEDGGEFCGRPTEACSAGCIEVDGQEAKIYEIEPGVIRATGAEKLCPRDHRKGAAYVDAIDAGAVGRATMMLSYTWNYTVRDIVEGLVEYCDTAGLEEGSTYVWICCLCISACC